MTQSLEVAEISFEAGGTTYRFSPPTARIAFNVSRAAGGLTKVRDRCVEKDLDALCTVLSLGCPDVPKTRPELEDFVFRHCDTMIWEICGYVWSLEHGGKPPPGAPNAAPAPADEETEDGEAAAEGNAEPAAAAAG